MNLSATVTATTKTELKLKPSVRTKLRTALRTFGELKQQMKALELAMTKQKDVVEEVMSELGEQKIELDGYKATLVAPVRSKLHVDKLIAQGVTPAQIEMATTTSPGTSYTKITVPGAKDEE